MSYNFSNETSIVFGASKGIGLATAKKLAEYGVTVVLAARRYDQIELHAQRIREQGGNAYACKCDVSNFNSVSSCVEFSHNKTGRLDIVVNNAGVIEPLTHLVDSDPTLWAQAIDINFKGVYNAIRACAPHMKQKRAGTIVNMSSGAANSILEGWSHYCSTKAAVKKLTEVAHKELHNYNIRVVGLSPGTVATSMMEKIRDAKINAVSNLDWSSHIPPEWVAEAVAFLCGSQGNDFAGTDFSIKNDEGRKLVGLPIS